MQMTLVMMILSCNLAHLAKREKIKALTKDCRVASGGLLLPFSCIGAEEIGGERGKGGGRQFWAGD